MNTVGFSSFGSRKVGAMKVLEDTPLNWDVTKNPLVTLLDGKYPLPVTSHMSMNRSDTNESIGIVGSGYQPIQNTAIWEALHKSLDGITFDVVGAGYLSHGGRVFIQAIVDDEDFRVHGDEFKNIITLYSSHDGSSAFEVFDTSVRIVCQNTLQAARRQGGGQFKLKVRHTSGASLQFINMMDQLERIFASRRRTYRDLAYLNEIAMSHPEMVSWAVSFFNAKNDLSGTASARAAEVVTAAKTGMGNRGQTAYDLFNGVTEVLTHGRPNTSKMRAEVFKASEFGTDADRKAEALDLLADQRRIAGMVARGNQLRENGQSFLKRGAMLSAAN